MASQSQQSAVVVGLGATGLSCARYLSARGYRVTVVDTRAQPPRLSELRREFPDIPVHTGELQPAWFADAEMLVVSPGVSLRAPVIVDSVSRGCPAVGDVELFARAASSPVLAITGSNGKSTVTSLAGAMCREAGRQALVGGNIGVPVLDLLCEPPPDVYVLELSSFQLETTSSLNARAAAVLNVTPDHMDRYTDMEEYAAAKARIFHGDGVMVLNRDDPRVMAMAMPGRRVLRFGLGPAENEEDFGILTKSGEEWLCRGKQKILACRDLSLPGRHNLGNALAAMAVAAATGVPIAAMRRAIRGFKGLPHRCEIIAERNGVLWINDSKGTNVGASVAALNGMNRPVILIAGGDGKGADFGALRAPVAAHARAVVLIGRDAPRIESALGGAVPVERADDMADAVARARALARTGDAVLLSPACASFDMFRNFEHRGQTFTEAVQEALK